MAQTTISATVSPLIPQGSASPLQLTSITGIRGISQLGTVAGQLATDLTNIQTQINRLISLGQNGPGVSQILLQNPQGQVVAAFGDVTYQGVVYTNYLSEIHVGSPLGTNDPSQALFNANTDGSVAIGQNGWFDVHDPFDGNAAWIGTQFDTLAITNAYNNGAGLIRLTVPGHNLATNNVAQVRNMQFYGVPNGTGTWPVTVIDTKTVDLQGSVWAGAFTAPANPPAGINTFSPTIDNVQQIIGVTNSAGLIEIQTQVANNYETGDRTNIPNLPGVPNGVGQWTVTVVDTTHYTLDGSIFAGSFSGQGICLRYYAGLLAQQIAIGDSFPNYKLREFADGSLKIRNATITLTSGSSTIILDPIVPSIDLKSPAGEINLNATTGTITIKNSLGQIVATLGPNGINSNISSGVLALSPTPFGSLPSPAQGMLASVSDSHTQVWGDPITSGGGSFNVLAYYNGSNWTVSGK